jgi:acetyl esterase/lipase
VPRDIEIIPSCFYAVRLGYRPLELDVYRPAGPGPWPCVVFFHGGGWEHGTRRRSSSATAAWQPGFFERLAARGIAVASADYRHSSEARFPAQVHDARDAVRYMRANAERFDIDVDRLAVWGASAGGHLAALVALDAPFDDPPTELAAVSSHVCAAVLWFPVTDLVAMDGPADTTQARLLGVRPADDPALARSASPTTYVSSSAPPFLLQHGTADTMVPLDQTRRLANSLTALGVEADVDLIEGSDHIWVGASPETIESLWERAVVWLESKFNSA